MASSKKLNPMKAQELGARAGALVTLSGRRQYHVARAFGVSDQAASNWRQGATYGPLYDALASAHQLAEKLACTKTDPFPALVEMEVVVLEGSMEHRETADLVREWRQLYQGEPDVPASEDAATRYVFRRDLTSLAQAHKAEAARSMRFAALSQVLERRGVDPLADEWRWLDHPGC